MAKAPYANNTVAQQSCPEYSLGLATNYACRSETPNEVLLDNLTAPKKKEYIRFGYKTVPTVNVKNVVIDYPSPLKTGVQFQVQLEEVFSISNPDGSGVYEVPINMYLTCNASDVGVTAEDIREVFQRLVSVLHDANGNWRFEHLLRGALKPSAD